MLELLSAKHPMLVHLPIAAAILLPLPLLLAQRRGLGVKPWWTVARYLAWAAFLGLLPALLSGLLWARQLGLLPAGKLLAPAGAAAASLPWLMRRHQLAALAALVLSLLTLWDLHRPRRDHQGLGKLGLLLGFAWAAASGAAGYYGGRMAYPAPVAAAAPIQAEAAPDPEAELPVRFLDYASLEAVQRAPVRGGAHGMKWERGWVTASAADAFKQGRPLPPGSYAVLSTADDVWGRPGPDPGPLYAYEILANGKAAFTVYWGKVAEARKGDFGGADSVYWRKDAPQVKSCLACHAGGASDPKQRVFESPRPRRPVEPEAAPMP